MKRERRRIGLITAGLLPAVGENTASVLVPAADFVDDGFTAQDYVYDETGGYIYSGGDTYTCMQAPLYLPDGATVSTFGGYVVDNDASGRIQDIELRRVAYQPGAPSLSQEKRVRRHSTSSSWVLSI